MGGIGFAFIFVGDVFVAARYSTEVLAAVSISGAITSIIFMFGIGMLSSISAFLSNRLGAKKSAKSYLIPSIKFAEILAFISFLAIIGVIPFFKKLSRISGNTISSSIYFLYSLSLIAFLDIAISSPSR